MLAKDFAHADESIQDAAARYMEARLSEWEQTGRAEEVTDAAIDWLMPRMRLPWWIPGRLVRRVLDSMLPGQLFGLVRHLLRRL